MQKLINLFFLALIVTGCSASGQLYTGLPEPLTCIEADLPGEYSLLEDMSGNRTNEGLISNSGDPAGISEYIEATGRTDGWEKRFMLGELTTDLPGFILCEAVTFESTEGAGTALHWADTLGYQAVETDRQIGDELLVSMLEFPAPDGSTWLDYRVEFTYHNILGAVHTYTPTEVASLDYALDLAEKMLVYFKDPRSAATQTPVP
jgi:hypothetical protein